MKTRDLIALVSTCFTDTYQIKYCSTVKQAFAWAESIANGNGFEVIVMTVTEDKPIIHYKIPSLWDQEKEV